MKADSFTSTAPNRTLVIGFGNPFRRDDGVAVEIIALLRREYGLPPLSDEEDGEDSLGGPLDTLMLHQLLPELAETLAQYNQVVFVDAHLGVISEEVRVIEVREEYEFHSMTHHFSPGTLLTMTRITVGRAPRAWLVSVRGEDFGFGQGLSEACRAKATTAAQTISRLYRNGFLSEA